jgi:hypothetical protein
LLLSQCDPAYPDDYIPLPTADWQIIGEAICMFQVDKGVKREDLNRILQQLKDNGHYEAILGK